MVKEYTKGEAKQLSKNFKSTEFDCKCKNADCKKTLIELNGVVCVQKARDLVGKPIKINSGFRCKKHNKSVGGVSGSLHLKGSAFDLACPKGISLNDFAFICEQAGFNGVLRYDGQNFVHCDMRSGKYLGFTVDGGKTFKQIDTFNPQPIKVDTFGGNTDENIKEWQKAAIADGFDFKSGADGIWGAECEAVAEKAICKKRIVYKYKNLTKIVQRAVGVKDDGKYGTDTKNAVKKWQGLMGLTADGIVGENTWKKILGVK